VAEELGAAAVRAVLAPNASPMTLDGTRTYLVGTERVVVIDPGPADPAHLDAVAEEIGDGVVVGVVVTHGHPDHSAGAAAMAARWGVAARSAAGGGLEVGDRIETDAGELVVVATPGHTPDHVAFHLPAAGAVFCGDLMMGGMETALVAAPEGDLGAYLASLARVRSLAPRVIYPGHGEPFTDPAAAIDAYVRHREERERQVVAALAAGADSPEAIVAAVYGEGLPSPLRRQAARAVVAYLEHLERTGRIRRADGGRWVCV
jgi:glyoxylase-like metal-dependent hydrolase (beta-lactamase superfamily II)